MTKEEITNKTMEVIDNPKISSNSDLIFAMEVVQKDFESVKETLIKLSHHLDSLETTYDLILKEYNSRTNGIK